VSVSGTWAETRLEPEPKGRFQVFFGGKFCYQFYFVMKMEKCNNYPASEVVIKWNFRAARTGELQATTAHSRRMGAGRTHPCPS